MSNYIALDIFAALFALVVWAHRQNETSFFIFIEVALSIALLEVFKELKADGWSFFLFSGMLTATILIAGALNRVSKTVLFVYLVSICINFLMCFDYRLSWYTVIDLYYEQINGVIIVALLIMALVKDDRGGNFRVDDYNYSLLHYRNSQGGEI